MSTNVNNPERNFVPCPQTCWDRQPPASPPKCPECGIELTETMYYVCPRGGQCPIGLGGIA